jgi:hypothetical protein
MRSFGEDKTAAVDEVDDALFARSVSQGFV